jgi:hypothetical protein
VAALLAAALPVAGLRDALWALDVAVFAVMTISVLEW